MLCVKGRTMAVDTSAWMGEVMVSDNEVKMWRTRHGIVGIVGKMGCDKRIIEALEEADSLPSEVDMPAQTSVVVLAEDGAIYEYEDEGARCVVSGGIFAAGTGTALAYGAMYSGATAEQAVALCIERCPYVGGTVVSMTLDPEVEADEQATVEYAEVWRAKRGL